MLPHEPRAVQPDLWSRLEAFDLDGASRFSFSQRLARDNGWTLAFARRVVVEYKKFVFLAATCAHPVTPSDEVDQAWHLHLVYTRSYWDELCGQVLGFPLHHGPTTGGAAEGHKFQDWYARTLQAYRAAFGALPPPDIWPAARIRFGEAPHFRRVNVRRHLLLPRPRWNPVLSRRAAVVVAAALVLVGCTARTPLNPLNWYGTEFLYLYGALCATLLPLALWLRYRGRGPEDELAPGEVVTTYEMVRLARRGERVADSALAALVQAGKVKLLPEQKLTRTDGPPPEDAYELAVWNLITPLGWSKLAEVREKAMRPTIGALRDLDAQLEAKGLLLPPAERHRLNRLPRFTALALGLFGAAKLLVGLSRDRPVVFLFLSMVALVYAYAFSRRLRPWATGRGTRLLRETRARTRQHYHTDPPAPDYVALTVALFSFSELNALGLEEMAVWFAPPVVSGSGDGGGSDGDGGCGSSGCGGCGGD